MRHWKLPSVPRNSSACPYLVWCALSEPTSFFTHCGIQNNLALPLKNNTEAIRQGTPQISYMYHPESSQWLRKRDLSSSDKSAYLGSFLPRPSRTSPPQLCLLFSYYISSLLFSSLKQKQKTNFFQFNKQKTFINLTWSSNQHPVLFRLKTSAKSSPHLMPHNLISNPLLNSLALVSSLITQLK